MAPITPREHREMERRNKHREGRLRRKYPEVHGKVVDFITHTIRWHALFHRPFRGPDELFRPLCLRYVRRWS